MSGNVRVITTFQFVCPVTTNGVVSTTTLPIGASALPRAIRPTNSASTTQVGGGSASLTTSLPSEKMPTAFPSATPVTTTILTTLPNGEVSTIVTATMLPPLTTATRTVGIIPFTTTLTVDTFPTPRPVDLDAYLPAYAAKGDGSLITPLYVQSSTNEHIRIFITGALLMLFIRNIFTSIDYLRRTSSRDRTLFWLLLISQLWGPVRFIPVAAGFFNRTADCKAIQIVSYTALEISYSILITFILGMKAYRCLERSKVVLAVVATLQIAAYALYIIGLPSTSVTRELSGDCLNTSTTPFIMAGISVQFVETLFIFLCFLYAVIKSSRRSATQGRMSIALSSVAGIASVVAPITSPQIRETNKPQGTKEKRGWWDYVPDSHVSIGVGGLGGPRFLPENQPSNNQEAADEHAHPVESWRTKIVSAIWKRGDAPNIQSRPVSPGAAAPRKSSIRGDEPIPHPNRGAFGTLSEKQLMGLGANANHMPDLALVDSRTGLATGIESARTGSGARSRGKTSRGARSITERQTFSGIMRMPKMILLRAVMKDELLYTAMIALTCVLSSIGLVLGAAQSNLLFGGAIWLEINWAVVSLLVMRSYAQVIARQERDAVLQDPSAWNVAIRTEDGLGRSPILRRGAADYGFARAQRVPPSFISRRSDISSRAFYPSPTRRPNTLSVSDYGSAVERARRADESRPSVQPLPATDPDDPFSEFERIVDMPRARDREPGSPVPSSLHGVQTWHDDDKPGPSDSVSQALGPRRSIRGPPPTVPRRGALTDYSIDIGTLSMMGIVPQKSIDRGLPSPHGSGSRDSSAYEPSFIEAFPETPIEPRITHS